MSIPNPGTRRVFLIAVSASWWFLLPLVFQTRDMHLESPIQF